MSETVHPADLPDAELPLSAVLADIADHGEESISVQQLTERFGGRAIGALLFVFGLACMLPLPPGATTIFGVPLVLLAPQLIIGAAVPWLPVRAQAGKAPARPSPAPPSAARRNSVRRPIIIASFISVS